MADLRRGMPRGRAKLERGNGAVEFAGLIEDGLQP
jgi:hypothetical protein